MDNPNSVVGRNVGRLRNERQMSVSELSRTAGISKATVLSIELGTANPTVSTLQSLSSALDVGITELLSESEATDTALVRRRADASWHPLGTLSIRPLTTMYGSNLVYVFVAELSADGYSDDGHEPNSIETLYVLSGTVEAGPTSNPQILAPGDFIRFNAETPHMYRAVEGTAEALLVISRNQVPEIGHLAGCR